MKYVWLTAAIVVALGTAVESVQAEVWKITNLKVLRVGVPTPQSTAVLQVASSPQGPWITKKYIVNDTIADGSLLRVRADTEVRLTSAQSVNAEHNFGSDGVLELRASNARRNAFAVIAGRWLFKVEQQLDSVSVSAGPNQALTRGTEFIVTVDPSAQKANFIVNKGSIDVVSDTVVKIAQQAIAFPPNRKLLKVGDPPLDLPTTADAYLVHYGTFGGAVSAFEDRLKTAVKMEDAVDQFNALIALGDILRAAGRGSDALARYKEAMTTAPGAKDGYWRAMLQGRQGDALLAQNRFSEAAQAYQQSISEHAAAPFLAGQDFVTDQRANLSQTYLVDGTYRCAKMQADTVLAALDARTHTQFSPSRAMALQVKGGVAAAAQQQIQAIDSYTKATALWRTLGYPKKNAAGQVISEELVGALNGEGSALLQASRLDAAVERYREALTIASLLFTGPHALQADARLGLAWVNAMRGHPEDALGEVDQILTLLDAAPHDVLRKGDAQQARGSLLLALGRPVEAVAALERAKGFWREIWPDHGHPRFAGLMPMLATALRASGTAEAETQAQAVEMASGKGAIALEAREQACLH